MPDERYAVALLHGEQLQVTYYAANRRTAVKIGLALAEANADRSDEDSDEVDMSPDEIKDELEMDGEWLSVDYGARVKIMLLRRWTGR